MDRKILFQIYHIMRERRFLPALDQESQHGPWALKKLMQSTHIYRASGVVGYKRKKYAAYDKGRAELPEPDFACRSFRSYQNLVRERCPQTLLYANSPAPPPYEDRYQATAAGTPQNRAHPTTTPVENPISIIARMCMGGQAQSAPARLVCQKARRAAAVNGAKRSS